MIGLESYLSGMHYVYTMCESLKGPRGIATQNYEVRCILQMLETRFLIIGWTAQGNG